MGILLSNIVQTLRCILDVATDIDVGNTRQLRARFIGIVVILSNLLESFSKEWESYRTVTAPRFAFCGIERA